jgi:ribosome-associated toxin RatA of RatAB toxin-antitoxin module
MHSENSIFVNAPPQRIFDVASDLSRWPAILPHYRRITYLDRSANKNIVIMAAWRNLPILSGAKIPVHWTSEQEIDREKMEIRFHHLKAFTKGMRVTWTFTPTQEGTEVRIVHDLHSNVPVLGRLIIEPIVGQFFIHFIANETLKHMKVFMEKTSGS